MGKPGAPDLGLGPTRQIGAPVGEAGRLASAQVSRERSDRGNLLESDQLLYLRRNHGSIRVSPGSSRPTLLHRLRGEEPVGFGTGGGPGALEIGHRPVEPSPRGPARAADRFLERLLKVRPMAMTSPTDFIWVVSVWSASGTSKASAAPSPRSSRSSARTRPASAGDVVAQLVERVTRELRRDLAIGKPVAFDASAEERPTQTPISMTTSRPSAGFTANWMFDLRSPRRSRG